MKNHTLTLKQNIFIGSMLFGLFFGAGNLIFPIHLGQTAGANVWLANLGFLITAIGLPFLGNRSIKNQWCLWNCFKSKYKLCIHIYNRVISRYRTVLCFTKISNNILWNCFFSIYFTKYCKDITTNI